MVKTELDFVYITTDGRKFLNKEDAILWQEGIEEDAEQESCITDQDLIEVEARDLWEGRKNAEQE